MKELKKFWRENREWFEGLFTGVVPFSMLAVMYWLYMSLYAIGF